MSGDQVQLQFLLGSSVRKKKRNAQRQQQAAAAEAAAAAAAAASSLVAGGPVLDLGGRHPQPRAMPSTARSRVKEIKAEVSSRRPSLSSSASLNYSSDALVLGGGGGSPATTTTTNSRRSSFRRMSRDLLLTPAEAGRSPQLSRSYSLKSQRSLQARRSPVDGFNRCRDSSSGTSTPFPRRNSDFLPATSAGKGAARQLQGPTGLPSLGLAPPSPAFDRCSKADNEDKASPVRIQMNGNKSSNKGVMVKLVPPRVFVNDVESDIMLQSDDISEVSHASEMVDRFGTFPAAFNNGEIYNIWR